MPCVTVYSLKIKIISIHFKIRALNDHIQFQLLLGSKMIDLKEVKIMSGLLLESVTLQSEISDRDIQSNLPMEIVLTEKHKNQQEKLGNIVIAAEEVKNIKMRKFQIQNCFDNSAYLEAFLLLIPTKRVEDEQAPEGQALAEGVLSPNIKRVQSGCSIVDINIEEEHSEREHSEREHSESDHSQSEKAHQEYQVTFNASERLNTVSLNGSERLDIDSLLTLNQILNETNNQLTSENRKLKESLKKMEDKLTKHTQDSKNTQKMLKSKMSEFQLKLKQKQAQLSKRCEQIQKLQLENQAFQKQVLELQSSLKAQINQELKIDSIILQLSKYSESANRCRSKTGSEMKRTETKLTKIPKIPIITLTKETLFKETAKTSRSTRQTSRSTAIARQKQGGRHDETLDTMKEASSVLK